MHYLLEFIDTVVVVVVDVDVVEVAFVIVTVDAEFDVEGAGVLFNKLVT
jgi:hypothetical protein